MVALRDVYPQFSVNSIAKILLNCRTSNYIFAFNVVSSYLLLFGLSEEPLHLDFLHRFRSEI